MKRMHWSFLFCAAVAGLVLGLPLSARATLNPSFQSAEINTLDLGDTGVSTGSGGLVELNNTGLVITNVLNSTYYHNNGNNNTAMYTGQSAIIKAVLDGMAGQTNSQGQVLATWQGTQGITGINAAASPGTYGIAFAYSNNIQPSLYGSTWGGTLISSGDTANNGNNGDMLIRETYVGDANLAGQVDVANDYDTWAANFGTVVGQDPTTSTNGNVGITAGDFANYSFLNPTQPVDVANDYDLWAATFGDPPLGGVGGPVHLAGVAAVPEPSNFVLLAVAGLFGLVLFAIRRLATLISFRKVMQMRRVGVALVAICLVVALSLTAQAELVYFLRPVTGSVAGNGNNGNGPAGNSGDSEGTYTISGNGMTTPYTVDITSLPAAGTTDVISFELYAAVVGRAQPWYDQAYLTGNLWIQQTTTAGATTLVPDVGDSLWQNGFSGALGTAVGPQWGSASASGNNINDTNSKYTYPSTKSAAGSVTGSAGKLTVSVMLSPPRGRSA